MRPLLLLSLALCAPLARAESLPDALAATSQLASIRAPAPEAIPVIPRRVPTGSRFGVLLDVGAPEGASASLAYRPLDGVRVWAGPAWNYVSWGFQGGVAVVPFRWAVSPVLSAEVGRFFDADLTPYVNDGSGAPSETKPLLRDVGFQYAAGHVGVEVGSQRGFAFSLRVGLAYVRAEAKGSTRSDAPPPSGESDVYFADPTLRATVPSVKLGLQLFF
jgi:hypothetical protein